MNPSSNNTQLKSAEEWYEWLQQQPSVTNELRLAWIEQIQLNAFKAGMTEAAEICKSSRHNTKPEVTHYTCMVDKILSARDKKVL